TRRRAAPAVVSEDRAKGRICQSATPGLVSCTRPVLEGPGPGGGQQEVRHASEIGGAGDDGDPAGCDTVPVAEACAPVTGRAGTARRIAVIGAGPSGLATIKELLDEGHDPVCFERAAGIGGVFRFGEADGRVWESCRLTSSPLLTSFSDFPAAADQLMHL